MPKELNMEELAKQDTLSEEQIKQIHESAYADELGEKKEPQKPAGDRSDAEPEEPKEPSGKEPVEEEAEKSDEEILDAKEEELNDGEKERRQQLIEEQDQKEKELLETPDDQLDEEKLKQKQELTKKAEQKHEQTQEQRIKEYAEQANVTQEEAAKEIKQIDEIKQRYEGDVDKIAKSNLYLQRMASKAKNEIKRVRESAKGQEVTADHMDKLVQNNEFIVNGKAWNKEMLIKAGRNNKEWADITESMDDEAVYKMVLRDLTKQHNSKLKEQQSKVKQTAETKRVEAIRELANYDNKFYEQAKGILENMDDQVVASEYFDVRHVLTQVKGSRYDKDLKAAQEDAYKRGLEKAKIMEKTSPVGGGKTKKAKPKGSVANLLNGEQKKRAQEMYQSLTNKSDEDKYRMYMEIYPEEFKKNKQ